VRSLRSASRSGKERGKLVESLEDELLLVIRAHWDGGTIRYVLLGRYVLFIYQTYLAFSYFCQQACFG
jgi:hypothetical protein